MPCQGGQRKQATDEHGDRHQLVAAPGQGQQHKTDGLAQPIAILADILELMYEIEEAEQQQECHQYQQGGRINFTRQIALEDFQRHRRGPQANSHRRLAIRPPSNSSITPCTASMPALKAMRSWATQA